SMSRLSPLQEGMLFHSLYDEQVGAYIEQFTALMSGLVPEIFIRSWEYLVQRYTILRSGFYYDVFKVPVQCVYRDVEIPVIIQDYSHLSQAQQQWAIAAYEQADRQQSIDLTAAPLMRITLLRTDNDHYRLFWTYHHILMDGWSLAVLLAGLLEVYEQLATGQSLPAISVDRYEDYIRYIERKDRDAAAAYWRKYLGSLEGAVMLPFINTTEERNKGIGIYKQEHLHIDITATLEITRFAQRNHITLNTLMQGVWAYLLYRYTGHKDIVYGVTVSGRPDDIPGVEQRVGPYINTLPIYANAGSDLNVSAWLRAIQADQVNSREYQYTRLNDISRWKNITGELFDSILVFENYPVNKVLYAKQWKLQAEGVSMHEHVNYPLSLVVGIREDINIHFSYNSSLLDTCYVTAIAGHFRTALLQMTTNENGRLDDIELLTAEEYSYLVKANNENSFVYPTDKTLTDLFEDQVRQTPSLTAILHNNNCLTYQEVEERSNRLAQYLVSKGVERDMLIPLFIERSPEMIIAMLGVLKSGAAYVPVHPDYPSDRIAYILSDISATLVLSSVASAGLLQTDLPVIQ
ncbi:MAG TPA: condensation domain-containing protein, partial [Chitinophaga sp.]|uniref:condensation domain-containing protein n=1 Tax=Chitinophaga sp. TaxID=1869181 RepID=UPI002B673681